MPGYRPEAVSYHAAPQPPALYGLLPAHSGTEQPSLRELLSTRRRATSARRTNTPLGPSTSATPFKPVEPFNVPRHNARLTSKGDPVGQDDQEWSWVGEDGVEHSADEGELSFALSSEDLPPYTLVHKRGWGEWLPAMQVAELLWALPAGRSDNPRKPVMGQKPLPPLAKYPSLKKRARDIARGLIDPAAESSLSLPAISVKPRTNVPRPGSNPNSSPEPLASRASLDERHPPFSASDQEEPTLQIDTEELDQAFEQLEANAPRTGGIPSFASDPPEVTRIREAPRPLMPGPPTPNSPAPVRSPPPPPAGPPPIPATAGASSASEQGPELDAPIAPNAARGEPSPDTTSSRSQPRAVPTAPPPLPSDAFAAPPSDVERAPSTPAAETRQQSTSPSAPARFAPPPLVPRPVESYPGQSPLDTPLPSAKKPKWPLLAAALAIAGVGGFLLWGPGDTVEQAPAPVVTATAPAKQPEPPKPVCNVTTTPIAIAGWAHVGVRPLLAKAPGVNRVAVGYAQTSKLAVGLVLDHKTLNAEKPFSNYQNSPLLSVTPVTQAMGQQLSFLESRAASTLQSAVYVPAKTPFAIGHNGVGVAIRREGEGDEVLWKPQWETINVPATARLDDDTHILVIRAGGERGSILMAKMTEAGQPKGELQELAPGVSGLGLPSVAVSHERVVVSFDGSPRGEEQDHVYLASWARSELAGKAQPVLSFDEPVEAVAAAALPNGFHLVQYTLGALTKQRVLARVISADGKPVGNPVLVSPEGKDAYAGEMMQAGDDALVVYMVRSGSNHELWATRLTCTTAP